MCSKVIEQVRGIVFLATPHRGAGDAKLLNLILEASPFATSRKEYVAQLEPTSPMLQDINDQFSKMCGELALVSLYETMRTVFGRGVKKLVRSISIFAFDFADYDSRLWKRVQQYLDILKSTPALWLRITMASASSLAILMRIIFV